MPKTTTSKTVKPKRAVKKSASRVKKVKPVIIDETKPSVPEKIPAAVMQAEVPAAKTIKTRALDFIIFGSLFLVFLLCPIFFTGLTAQGVVFEKMVLFYFLVLIGTAGWAAKMAVRREISFKRTALDLPILGISAVWIISTLFAVNQWASLTGSYGNSAKSLIALIIFILFYYLIVNNTDTKKVKILFWALIFSFSSVLIYSLLQVLGIFILPFSFTESSGFIPVGTLSSLSKLAVVMLPALVLTAAGIAKKGRSIKEISLKWVLIIISLIGFIILAILSKITFWPAAIAGMAFGLFFILLKKIKVSSNNLIIPITAFLLLVIFLVLGNLNIGNINVANEPMLSRGESWNIAKSSVKENPLFGSGPATFYYDFSKFKSVDFNMSQFWNIRFVDPSGFLFDALASVGILGTLALLIAIVSAFVFLGKRIFEDSEDETKDLLAALFSSLIALFAVSLFLPFDNYIILISVIVFGLAYSAAVAGENLKEINIGFEIASGKNYVSAVIFIAALAGIAVMFVFSAKNYLADVYAGRALAAADLSGQIENLNRAVKLAPNQDIYRVNLANSYIISVNQEAALENVDKNKIIDNLSNAVKQARAAVEIAPEKAANNEFLALVYEKAAALEGLPAWSQSIKNAYEKIIELEPANPIPYYKLALINMAESGQAQDEEQKNTSLSQAVLNYDKAILLKSDLAPAYYGKGIANEKKNDLNGAISELKSAVEKSGGNIDYAFELGRVYFNRGIAKAEAADDLSEGGEEDEEESDDQGAAPVKVKRNEDINIANQIFLSILQVEPNHANALYSLALIYQAVGEDEDMKLAAGRLLQLITDEAQKEKIREQFNIQ